MRTSRQRRGVRLSFLALFLCGTQHATFLVVFRDEAAVVTHQIAAYIAQDENHEAS